MGTSTDIAWTDATWNPWIGCQRVSPGCQHCYAEVDTFTRVSRSRGLELWGPPATTARHRTSAANWRLPERLDRRAMREGRRIRLFVASLCDIFEDAPQVSEWRDEALAILECCTHLDVQLLTKRPENVRRMVPPAWLDRWPAHVWIGTTAEDQQRADERIPHLLRVPAAVRFLSVEPMLGDVRLRPEWLRGPGRTVREDNPFPTGAARGGHARSESKGSAAGNVAESQRDSSDVDASRARPSISWCIVGGESGPKARPCDVAWIRDIVQQCHEADVPVFVKQAGANVRDRNDVGFEAELEEPTDLRAWPTPRGVEDNPDGVREEYQGAPVQVHLRDRAGRDPSEWPKDLRVREFPGGVQ